MTDSKCEIQRDAEYPGFGFVIRDGERIGMADREGTQWVILLDSPRRTITVTAGPTPKSEPVAALEEAEILAIVEAHVGQHRLADGATAP